MKKLIPLLAIGILILLSNGVSAQPLNWQWAKSAGGTDNENVNSTAVDGSGNVYVTGAFLSPTIDFGNGPLTNMGNSDLFLAKYDGSGNLLWAKSAGGTEYDDGIFVAVDASGNVFVTGRFTSPTIDFGNGPLTNVGYTDLFLVKYDGSGNLLWATSAGGISEEYVWSVAVDASGNALVTGLYYSPTLAFGGNILTNVGNADLFLAKYDSDGNVLWANSAGGTGFELGWSVAMDVSGNAYVSGAFNSPTITFGSTPLTNVGMYDIFLAKYDGTGNVLWAESYGGTNDEDGRCVVVGPAGDIYLTGYCQSPTLTFGATPLTNVGQHDIYLVKFDDSGNVLWAQGAGGIYEDFAYSVAADNAGNAYVTGTFWSPTITFGTIPVTGTGVLCDMFLAKYDNAGNVKWATSAGGANEDMGVATAVDASGNVFVTGDFYSPGISFGIQTLTNMGVSSSDLFLAKTDGTIVGVRAPDDLQGMTVRPNPAAGKIRVALPEGMKGREIRILNAEGEEVIRQPATGSVAIVDISGLPAGVYFVKLLGEQAVQVTKFIRQ
jgi:hypothetical protein